MVKKKTAKKKTAKKKIAKKNTVVVIYDSYGSVEEAKIFSREDARKYCIEHNLATMLNGGEPWNEEETELIETIEKLIAKDKWSEVFRLWDELGRVGNEFHRGADWYPLK
jgi:hypothetical protein